MKQALKYIIVFCISFVLSFIIVTAVMHFLGVVSSGAKPVTVFPADEDVSGLPLTTEHLESNGTGAAK